MTSFIVLNYAFHDHMMLVVMVTSACFPLGVDSRDNREDRRCRLTRFDMMSDNDEDIEPTATIEVRFSYVHMNDYSV